MDSQDISSTIPDWTREDKRFMVWDPGRSLLASIRSWQRAEDSVWPLGRAIRIVAVFRYRFWSVVSGADIPLKTKIGGGLLLPHPNGIVVHPEALIGPNCLIFQQVTIGESKGRVPRIGGHVDIGAGAKVLGGISVGSNVRIGANSVVLTDVPDGASAVGIPARVISD